MKREEKKGEKERERVVEVEVEVEVEERKNMLFAPFSHMILIRKILYVYEVHTIYFFPNYRYLESGTTHVLSISVSISTMYCILDYSKK